MLQRWDSSVQVYCEIYEPLAFLQSEESRCLPSCSFWCDCCLLANPPEVLGVDRDWHSASRSRAVVSESCCLKRVARSWNVEPKLEEAQDDMMSLRSNGGADGLCCSRLVVKGCQQADGHTFFLYIRSSALSKDDATPKRTFDGYYDISPDFRTRCSASREPCHSPRHDSDLAYYAEVASGTGSVIRAC
jgi:hypothetical protein